MTSFTPIGKAIDDNLHSKGDLQQQLEATQLVEYAEEVFLDLFGKEKAVHTKPLFLKNRTLTVTCSSSVMAQEIRLNQAKIVAALNKKLGKKEVDRIRYLV